MTPPEKLGTVLPVEANRLLQFWQTLSGPPSPRLEARDPFASPR